MCGKTVQNETGKSEKYEIFNIMINYVLYKLILTNND